jgi:sigma-B regulation protein RsbU (phosphoserine phosphatase)
MTPKPSTPSDSRELEHERLELALRASNEGIWDWHPDQPQIHYSRRILEFLECGDRRAPNLFLPPFDCVHPEERPAFERAVTQALTTSGPETLAVDARILTGSGSWRWLRIRGAVVRDRQGIAKRIAGSMIDISRRKDAEAQVEEERFLLRNLIDHVPLQIYFKDLESRVVMANQGMADWHGVPSGNHLIGKHDRDLFDEEHARPAAADEQEIIRTGQPITHKLEQETWFAKDETWVITSKFPWRDRTGTIKGTFGVSSNVTELVQARQQATALAEELQRRNLVYEEELQLAREVQQALAGGGFPKTTGPHGHNLTFGSRYIPISGLAGDFFEIVPISPHQAGILISDVMGHGVRSALIVAMLRGLLEKERSQAADPGAFLRGLNDGLAAILERAGTTLFATAFYGVIDLQASTLKYACAGHPGPVLCGPGGTTQIAATREEKGPGLGLIRGAAYPVGQRSLDQVDRIILFTDGVLEAENQQGEPFFENRLLEIVSNTCNIPLDSMLDAILNRVLDFSAAQHFDDDVCLLGVEVTKPTPSPSPNANT